MEHVKKLFKSELVEETLLTMFKSKTKKREFFCHFPCIKFLYFSIFLKNSL